MNIFKKRINKKTDGRRYFARHIKEGTVRYPDGLYYVDNDALIKMSPSFEGKPIFVEHVDNVKHDHSVGNVVKSFYNEFDGAHWAEIIINDDEAIGAIEKGWAVSNAYIPTEYGGGGVYHNDKYDKKVLDGYYEHLAIVNNPRYEEACIMTPEEYYEYNEGKKQEIEKLKNSKEFEFMEEKDIKSFAEALMNAMDERDKRKENRRRRKNETAHEEILEELHEILEDVEDGEMSADEGHREILDRLDDIMDGDYELFNRKERKNRKENRRKKNEESRETKDAYERGHERGEREDKKKENDLVTEVSTLTSPFAAAVKGMGFTDEHVKEVYKLYQKYYDDPFFVRENEKEWNEKEEDKREDKKENSKGFFTGLMGAKKDKKSNDVTIELGESMLRNGRVKYGSGSF